MALDLQQRTAQHGHRRHHPEAKNENGCVALLFRQPKKGRITVIQQTNKYTPALQLRNLLLAIYIFTCFAFLFCFLLLFNVNLAYCAFAFLYPFLFIFCPGILLRCLFPIRDAGVVFLAESFSAGLLFVLLLYFFAARFTIFVQLLAFAPYAFLLIPFVRSRFLSFVSGLSTCFSFSLPQFCLILTSFVVLLCACLLKYPLPGYGPIWQDQHPLLAASIAHGLSFQFPSSFLPLSGSGLNVGYNILICIISLHFSSLSGCPLYLFYLKFFYVSMLPVLFLWYILLLRFACCDWRAVCYGLILLAFGNSFLSGDVYLPQMFGYVVFVPVFIMLDRKSVV